MTKETIEKFEPDYFINQNNNHQPIGVAQQVNQDNSFDKAETIKLYERLLLSKDQEIATLKKMIDKSD